MKVAFNSGSRKPEAMATIVSFSVSNNGIFPSASLEEEEEEEEEEEDESFFFTF